MAYLKGAQRNRFNSYVITIAGATITVTQLSSIKIYWDIDNFSVIGEIVFHDETSLVEGHPLRGGEEIDFALTDSNGNPMVHKFEVSRVEYSRTQSNGNLSKIHFIDKASMSAISTYKSASLGTIDMPGAIHALIGGSISDKTHDMVTSGQKAEDVVVPKNTSYNWVLTWFKNNSNLLWFQTRYYYVLQSIDSLMQRGAVNTQFPYVYKPDNQHYRKSIYEYAVEYSDEINHNIAMHDSNMVSYNILDKGLQNMGYTYATSVAQSVGSEEKDFHGPGIKTYYMTHHTKPAHAPFTINKATYKGIKLEILVSGQFDIDIGNVVQVDLINWKYKSGPEVNLAGKWLIHSIVDIITPPDFIQRLTLVRAKFGE